VIAEDYAGMASVARAARTPIQAGENWWGPLEFAKAIDAGATDLLMPDVMKVFGVTGWMEIAAHRRREAPAGLVPPLLRGERAAARATPTAHWLEYADWWNPVHAHPLEIRGRHGDPSSRPGSGVEWK
jgi:mandelate racemase